MPTNSKEAPGELAVVRAFVNSRDVDKGLDELIDPAALSTWLTTHGLLDTGVEAGPADLRRAIALREGLRAMLLSNNDGRDVPPRATAALNDVAGRARLRLRVGPEGEASLQAEAGGVSGALGRLLVIVYRAMESGEWMRLKACRDDTCQWAFYDHSKNHSGHWCSMAVCGSREQARGYRERRRDGKPEGEKTTT